MNISIEALNDFAAHWATALFRASWQGGLALALVWIVCRVLPRIPARVTSRVVASKRFC